MLITGFCLRTILAFGLQYQLDYRLKRPFLIMGDANYYWELGEKIVAGKPYEIHHPPRRVTRMPGFPALLAVAISLSSGSYLFARLMLAAVGTIGCWLVFKLGTELQDETTGLIAGWLAAISPMMIGFSVLILSETMFGVLLVLSLIAMLRSVKSLDAGFTLQCYLWSTAAGATITIACYARPSWLLVAPTFACFLILRSHLKLKGLVTALCVMFGFFVTLAPWMYRNYQVTGHWVMTTLWDGPSLYDGFNEKATGKSNMYFIDQTSVLSDLSEYDANVYFRNKAWKFMKENPLRSLMLSFQKQLRFWSPYPLAAEVGRWWIKLPIALFYFGMLGTAFYGGWKHRTNFLFCLFAAGPIIYFAGIHTIFLGSMRYRHPAEYPLCLLSAVGLQYCWSNIQNKRKLSQVTTDISE